MNLVVYLLQEKIIERRRRRRNGERRKLAIAVARAHFRVRVNEWQKNKQQPRQECRFKFVRFFVHSHTGCLLQVSKLLTNSYARRVRVYGRRLALFEYFHADFLHKNIANAESALAIIPRTSSLISLFSDRGVSWAWYSWYTTKHAPSLNVRMSSPVTSDATFFLKNSKSSTRERSRQ